MLAMFLAAFIAVDGPIPKGDDNVCDTARFVKTFECGGEVRRATWTVSGLGVFRAYMNGGEVGADDCLKPGFTHVAKCRHSFSYDVTPLVKKGRNVLAAEVSTGWWRDAIVSRRGKISSFWGVLEIEKADGTKVSIPTDTTWRGSYGGNVMHATIYWGETYDARVDRADAVSFCAAIFCSCFSIQFSCARMKASISHFGIRSGAFRYHH